ncbi:MAG: divalent metal cation transporter [Haliscomenobacter sp.]|nr:divalent metal cation transporter [Haliscomenobacter sp.]
MAKRISFQKGLSSVLFWSVISAAFIGPGTVTTTSRAGALFQGQLLWALTFSTLATILLQETSARLTIASGKNLGEIIALQYAGKKGKAIHWGIFLALAFGCAAYEAGNLLGALSGLGFLTSLPRPAITLTLGFLCAGLLWIGNYGFLARLLGMMVAFMGATFLYVAFFSPITPVSLASGALIPHFPQGSALLIIGLIGTTIVPYNLFLGSGIGTGQDIREMRLGIALAVMIGGLISGGILLAGMQIEGAYSFENLSRALTSTIGGWGTALFGLGLFAAGLSSAITAPLAAAVAGSSLLGAGNKETWTPDSRNFRMVWGTVLGIGVLFGMLNFRPIPVIILAQALNGLLLPFMAIFLLFAANDRTLLGKYANGFWANLFTLIIVGVTTLLGLHNIRLALDSVFHFFEEGALFPVFVTAGFSMALMIVLGFRVFEKEKADR